ncbi:hypothetical protein IGI04_042602 [Brassica rapa subsp. trilocularis]|uniref:Uncharacterized protein n=1 Tax=Brassica rapa subsp. trilocularis TaxID=1813537 RepID=A0ABQ7KLD0_BRACM|nr:hypothetical protein IGI04_042602 [Brassica rapa subsp. trilocularis]
MGLACGSARREEKEERGNEWGWFSQMKATLKRCGVWRNHEKEESLKGKAAEKDQTARETSGNCFSLEESTLLEKIEDVYESKISLRRVYEVKKVISGGKPGREEFNNHVRKLQHLCVELQGLRSHVDGDTTQEQETVLKLLASMESSYGWLVEMVLRGEQLPKMEEICGLIRRAYEIMRDDERLTMSRSESSWKPTGSRSESFQKLTMSRSEGSWRLTGSRSEGFRKKRRCRRLSKASINIGKGRKRVVGECSYSAYMGESVEDSGVLREQEKGSGADDRITRKEWRVESSNPTSEAERRTPLDHERGNGTESHEQVQNQDSGQHNQEVTQEVESGAQSSGDGQRESTGSDESEFHQCPIFAPTSNVLKWLTGELSGCLGPYGSVRSVQPVPKFAHSPKYFSKSLLDLALSLHHTSIFSLTPPKPSHDQSNHLREARTRPDHLQNTSEADQHFTHGLPSS